MKKGEYYRRVTSIVITLIAFLFIIIHMLFPDFTIDTITIALIIIAIFPWILPYIKSIKLPGGAGIEFKESIKRVETNFQRSKISKVRFTFVDREEIDPLYDTLEKDPNLAMAYLRMKIEQKLKQLTIKYHPLSDGNKRLTQSLSGMLHVLGEKEIIDRNGFSSIKEIIYLCNKAVHGEEVSRRDAERVVVVGTTILRYLDTRLDD